MDDAIRPATPEDAQAVLSVARESWHAAYDDILGEGAVDAVIEDWYQLGDLRSSIGDSTFVVAERDGTVVGFAHAGPNPDAGEGTYQLYRLYVRPDLWGQAIGGRLLDRVADAVRAAGGDRFRLGVLADNDVGVSFYESRGFDRVDAGTVELAGETVEEYTYETSLT
ncbi:GNAT family N-acetyltransferase [Halobacteriales archaeon SW_12_69_24]|nr:MAG: GNAT family N-acetyltransferase [Halobacteriales archaeon SW_12_69_24]